MTLAKEKVIPGTLVEVDRDFFERRMKGFDKDAYWSLPLDHRGPEKWNFFKARPDEMLTILSVPYREHNGAGEIVEVFYKEKLCIVQWGDLKYRTKEVKE